MKLNIRHLTIISLIFPSFSLHENMKTTDEMIDILAKEVLEEFPSIRIYRNVSASKLSSTILSLDAPADDGGKVLRWVYQQLASGYLERVQCDMLNELYLDKEAST